MLSVVCCVVLVHAQRGPMHVLTMQYSAQCTIIWCCRADCTDHYAKREIMKLKECMCACAEKSFFSVKLNIDFSEHNTYMCKQFSNYCWYSVAQLVERLPSTQNIAGSNPA